MGKESVVTWISIIISVGVLAIFEVLKRKLFSVFSSEFINAGNKITNAAMSFAIGSLLVIGGSYYFSISGAVKLSNSSLATNKVIENTSQKVIDSLTIISENNKLVFIEDNEKLRQANSDLRNRIAETNSRSTITTYNGIVKDNLATIEFNNKEIANVDALLKQKITDIKLKQREISDHNINEDKSSYIVFFSISTLIELLIVVGIYYRELYEYKSFSENEAKLEIIHRKIERYTALLKFAFKNGEVHQDTQVLSANKLFELAKVSFGVGYYTQKNIDDFYQELTHLGAFKVINKKRYAALPYEDAIKTLDKLYNV
ncbi:MAG: hypothetical protein HC836_15670 [Richelia sp. RM2_1_2]|nr:hypothetical protein [Richelia sp. RM2_1_2]